MKKLLLILLALIAWQPALAVELHPDPGMNTPGSAMLDPASGNLWTVSSGTAHGNSAKAMQMLMWMAPGVKAGRKFLVTYTVSGRTHGVVEAALGPTMTGSATGTWKNVPSTVADNFTTANGITSGVPVASTSSDETGAFRMFCGVGSPATNDGVVYPGLPGRSHLHTPWGNTQSLNPYADATYWRTHGSSTCGDWSAPTAPINRSAYWMPSMLDGVGNTVQPLVINQYYKSYPPSTSPCTTPADPLYVLGAGGACVNIPNSISMIAGYNFGTGLGGPADSLAGYWECEGAGTVSGNRSQHLSDFFHGGCALRGQGGNAANRGGIIAYKLVMQTCWDGVHSDSPDHRSHVNYAPTATAGPYGKCDDAHPYHFPAPSPQVFWLIDSNFVAGKWHLSSDEMVAGKVSADPGGTMHMDYTNAWSPTALNTWYTLCIAAHKSCSSGALGDGTGIKDGGTLASTHGPGDPDQMYAGPSPIPQGRYYPTSKAGIGRPIAANGTFSQVITASADGRISLIAIEDAAGFGFDGQVDNMSVTAVAN